MERERERERVAATNSEPMKEAGASALVQLKPLLLRWI